MLVEVAQIVENIHEGPHTDVVIRVLHPFYDLVCQQGELGVHSFVFLQKVADMVHLR